MVQFTRTIPFWSPEGGCSAFPVTDADWTAIETRSGVSVRTPARAEIESAMGRFVFHVQAEKLSAPKSEARDRIEKIRKAAVVLKNAVVGFQEAILPSVKTPEAQSSADYLIKRALAPLPTHPDNLSRDTGDLFQLWAGRTAEMIGACDCALGILNDPENRGRRKGETWKWWVAQVLTIAAAHGMDISVRKDTDRMVDPSPSSIVRLIGAIEEQFPAFESGEAPRSLDTDTGDVIVRDPLSARIYRVKKDMQDAAEAELRDTNAAPDQG
jgi:hypothetical protein